MKTRLVLLLSLCICVLLAACKMGTGTGAEHKEGEIVVLRYDKLLSEYVRSNSFSAMQKLTMEYSRPTKILIEDVLSIGTVGDDTISQRLQKYYADSTLTRLIADVEEKFPNLREVEKNLTKGFSKLKKEVPETKIPFIYSQISAFNESVVLVDTLLGISLDKYMGEDYPLYKRFYYDYQCRSMRPERIAPDCLVFYLMSRYELEYHAGTCLLDLMLHFGKMQYVVQRLLEYKDMGEAMGYSEEENKWCTTHEESIWKYICANDHLHARDPMLIRCYMKPAPAVDILGRKAPPLIGIWLGGKIVSAYMKKHKSMKLKELLEFTEYGTMLRESGYAMP